jgi:hypothetical protein
MEEGCSSVYAVSDEQSLMRAHSAQNQLELEVEQPSQCIPGGPAGPIVTLLDPFKVPAASDLARKCKIATNPSKTSKLGLATHLLAT